MSSFSLKTNLSQVKGLHFFSPKLYFRICDRCQEMKNTELILLFPKKFSNFIYLCNRFSTFCSSSRLLFLNEKKNIINSLIDWLNLCYQIPCLKVYFRKLQKYLYRFEKIDLCWYFRFSKILCFQYRHLEQKHDFLPTNTGKSLALCWKMTTAHKFPVSKAWENHWRRNLHI